VPDQAKWAIERAMERASIGFDIAKTAIRQWGPPEDNDEGNEEDNGKPDWAGPPGG